MYKIYKVNAGDSLDSIASALGITVQELMNINGMAPNQVLVPGALLVVPVKNDSTFMKYVVKKGDNLYSIAQKYNTTAEQLLKLNGLSVNDYIYPDEEIMVPSVNTKFYITANDDTLNKVIDDLGINPNTLVEQNKEIYLIPDQLIVYKMNG